VLLTCPNCRSGLAVPDGTTAMVRCPACKTVFSAEENMAESEPEAAEVVVEEEEEEEVDEKPRKKPARKRPRRDEDDEDEEEEEKPRKKKRTKKAKRDEEDDEEEEKEKEGEPKNRDFDPDYFEDKRKKKRRRPDYSKFSPEERDALLSAFSRGAWGSMCIWISFLLFIFSMILIIMFWFTAAIPAVGVTPGLIVTAGVLGAIGWTLGAVGVGLCLSGPPSPGHWGYGIAAAIATGLHLILLISLVGKADEFAVGRSEDPNGPIASWGLVPTRLDTLTLYLTLILYRELDLIGKGIIQLSIFVGLAEMMRTMLILMLLSCLAEAAGDKELSYRCTRASGFVIWGAGFLALALLLFAVLVVETRMGVGTILLIAVVMGIYAFLAGCMVPAFIAGRDVADACDEPFQSQIPQL
jgi:LSD1 subclass zinc finger protein